MLWHGADPNRIAKIVGGVLGGVLPLLLIGAIAAIVVCSLSTYHHRAKKRLIQDQVYNLVMGVRHDDRYLDVFPDVQNQVGIGWFPLGQLLLGPCMQMQSFAQNGTMPAAEAGAENVLN